MGEERSEAALRALDILGKNPAFKGVTGSHIEDMGKHARTRRFAQGQYLMREGSVSDSLHVVVDGQVRVQRGGAQPALVADLGPGEVVGEMGVLTGEPRSATVSAVSDVETLELTADELKDVFRE